MGVSACARNGCENILCDRHSDTHGRICNDCFAEMVRTNPDNIELFMTTTPQGPDTPEWVKLKFETEFPLT